MIVKWFGVMVKTSRLAIIHEEVTSRGRLWPKEGEGNGHDANKENNKNIR